MSKFLDLVAGLQAEIEAEFPTITKWIFLLRPGSSLEPGQGVFRVFGFQDYAQDGNPRAIIRTVSCGTGISIPIAPDSAVEAQADAVEAGGKLSRLIYRYLGECGEAYRNPEVRSAVVDVQQKTGQDRGWYAQAFIPFEIVYKA